MAAGSDIRLSDAVGNDAGQSTETESKRGPESEIVEISPNNGSSTLKLFTRLGTIFAFETRGITRVPPEERESPSVANDMQIALLWFGMNISCNNLIVGLYGPLLFELGFLDSAMCAVFGALLGSLSTGYMAGWGPKSGNRTSESSPYECSSMMLKPFGLYAPGLITERAQWLL